MSVREGRLNGLKAMVIIACLGTVAVCASAEPLVLESHFDGETGITSDGWEVVSAPGKSSYEARDGVLRVTCRQNWYEDGLIKRRIPVIERGVLDFEANIAMEQAGNSLGVSLSVSLYNISTWFHGSCRDWRRYFPEGPSARISGFRIEPVGHRRLTSVPRGRWGRYRIVFDHQQGIVEYYRDNMQDPVHIDYDVPVLGRSEYEGGYLQIGSMGQTKGPLVHGIRNLTLRSMAEDRDKPEARTEVLIFRGISAHRHGIDAMAAAVFGEEHVRTYTLRSVGAAVFPKNQFKLAGLPSAATVRRAAKIILVDMPVEPGSCLPAPLLEQISEAVAAGADLIMFGGMFAFGKGGYEGATPAALLPLRMAGPWQVKRFGAAKALLTPAGALKGARGNAGVLWFHDVVPKQDADVLLTAGDQPIFVRWRRGKGSVGAFLGAALGDFDGTTGTLPFWESDTWRDWVKDEVF